MIGLLFLGLVAAWLVAARWLAIKATRRLLPGKLRLTAVCVITLMLVALPLSDEIVGGFQLRELCEKNAVLHVDAEKIKGKAVRLVIDPSNKDVEGTSIRIYYSHLSYRDVATDAEVASYSWYVAKGGWLIRMLSTDNGATPLIIHPSSCSAGLSSQKYGFTLVN